MPKATPAPARIQIQRGIQSIEVGGQLLRALAHHGRPLALKDLAQAAGMAPAKAHPYLVSFGKLGLIEQDTASGRYGLGPLAMQLGLISLQQLDPLALATPLLEPLAADCGHTLAVAVWGNRGATIVRVAEPPSAVHVAMRHGTVMSLRGTASGRLFAALLPREQVKPVWRNEGRDEARGETRGKTRGDVRASARKPGRGKAGFDADFDAALDEIRQSGISRVQDLLLPGISALAAPVFDGQGRLALALTAIGPTPLFDSRPGGTVARTVGGAAAALSARLGWRPA
jgi:DNA-binding IclR family transcriptional regulator